MCLLLKRSLDVQIYTRGKTTHSFPVVCLIGNGPCIQRPPAALPHDESLATEDSGAILPPGNMLWWCADPPVHDAEMNQREGCHRQPCPGLSRPEPRLERASMPTLQWAPTINPVQRRSHPIPQVAKPREKHVNNASEDSRSNQEGSWGGQV